MLLTRFGLGPPGCRQSVCWTGKHSAVWDSCCLKLVLQGLQMLVSIMLQSRHSDKEAIFQYEKQFLMITWIVSVFEKWTFGYIWRWHPWVSLKASSQCLWPLLSRVTMFLGWWHHRALKYMYHTGLRGCICFSKCLEEVFFFYGEYFLFRTHTVNCVQPGERYYWRVWDLTEESSCEKFCREFYHLSYI